MDLKVDEAWFNLMKINRKELTFSLNPSGSYRSYKGVQSESSVSTDFMPCAVIVLAATEFESSASCLTFPSCLSTDKN